MEHQWTQDLSIGVELIDNQHKELFQQVALLRSALQKGEGRGAVLKTIAFLQEYADAHFQAEEDLMRRHNYHGILEQTRAHELFRKELSDFHKKLTMLESRGEVTALLAIEFERRMSRWLVEHIGTVDKKLGTFLVDRR
jgi:hemerythrin